MPELTPRQLQILNLARHNGSVQVETLATHFDVTPQTIRKDLNDLCDGHILARTHGGAMLLSGVENMTYNFRQKISVEEKRLIGQRTAQLIPHNCSLFINIGTTTEEVANALIHHEGLLVITNNIHVARILMPYSKIDVIIAGGALRRTDGGIVGETAIDFMSQFKVDHAVIGTSAIDEDGDMLDFDFREVRAAQTILKNARNTILVADSLKFTRSAPVKIAHLSQVDMFVTDLNPPPSIIEICKESQVELIVTETHSPHSAELKAANDL